MSIEYKPIAQRPLPQQAEFLGVVVGMAKDAGYTLDMFLSCVKMTWPHVKAPQTTGDREHG